MFYQNTNDSVNLRDKLHELNNTIHPIDAIQVKVILPKAIEKVKGMFFLS